MEVTTIANDAFGKCTPDRYSVDLLYSVRFCYLPLKQWVVQFNNKKCYLLNYDLLMSTPTTTLNLPLQ